MTTRFPQLTKPAAYQRKETLHILIGVDRFSASAPGEIVMREYGFGVDHITRLAHALVEQHNKAG